MIALSFLEPEYISALCVAQQAIWMTKIMEELNFIPSSPTLIFCDNKSTISMSKNPMFHGRTKHIELRYHFIRDQVISVSRRFWCEHLYIKGEC